MKNKHISPTQKFFTRADKPSLGSHHSGSTIQNSNHTSILKYQNGKQDADQFNKLPKVQSPVANLRQDLKNIKLQVTKLIKEGFVSAPVSTEWLQQSGNMTPTLSRSKSSSVVSSLMRNDFLQADNKIYPKQHQFLISYQQFMHVKQQCENLRHICFQKTKKENQHRQKQKQLQKQIKALRKCNQQLTKCIQILQASLRETNIIIKQYIQQNNRLHKDMENIQCYNQHTQRELLRVKQLGDRLEEQVHFRKAENNELIRIIQIKQAQTQQLKSNYNSQIRSIQIQFYKTLEQQNRKLIKSQQQLQQAQRRARINSNMSSSHYFDYEYQNLQNQVQSLKNQLANRQRVMLMMLNDIKSMQAQLKAADRQHQQLLRYQKLINGLNQYINRTNAQNLAKKYKYY